MPHTFRQRILTSYLHNEELYEVIGHTWLYYLTIIPIHLLILIALWVLYGVVVISPLTDLSIVQWTIWLCIIIVYITALLKVLDAYLDGLLITNMWLVLFQRDGLFRQKAINLQRVSIETISFEQNSLWDTIFNKWTVSISVEDQRYVFEDVDHPRQAVASIVNRKEKILWRAHYSENEVESEEAMNKYEVLVEALWEVVGEYVQKKNGTML